jgi:hypothetical protein
MMLSYWEQDLFKPKYDYLIIGSGFSGLWMAYFLKLKKSLCQYRDSGKRHLTLWGKHQKRWLCLFW